MSDQTQAIRSLNDRFRRGDGNVPGHIVVTRGLIGLLKNAKRRPKTSCTRSGITMRSRPKVTPIKNTTLGLSSSKAIHAFGRSK